MVRRRATTLLLSGMLAAAAVLTAFAGSALATSPNAPVQVTDPPFVLVTDPPTLDPSATPCLVEVTGVKAAIAFCATPTPVITPDPCAVLSVAGAPNAPAPTADCSTPDPCVVHDVAVDPTAPPSVCPSSFESFQGQTATPPPTGTSSVPSNSDSSPLMPLLICLVMGGLGLSAVTVQRRAMRP